MWGWVEWGCILFFHFDLLEPKTRKATAQRSFRRLYPMGENTSAWCNLHVASGFAAIMWLSGKTHIFPSAAREQVETFHQLPAAVNIFGKHFKCVQVALDVSFAFLSGAASLHTLQMCEDKKQHLTAEARPDHTHDKERKMVTCLLVEDHLFFGPSPSVREINNVSQCGCKGKKHSGSGKISAACVGCKTTCCCQKLGICDHDEIIKVWHILYTT